MTPGMDVAPKRTRESTSKVRTGCSTCKARRVKCDELKPMCRRCTVGGRECEYTAVRAVQPRRNAITIYLPPAQGQPTISKQNHAIDFFHQNLATKLDGQFDSEFWGKLVLQLSTSEPAVRHAVSAISIIYQDVELSLLHPAGCVNANPLAQQEWNAAMKSLSARMRTHPHSNLVPLVCCLLFTCIEFLRGHGENSMLHVQSGIKIISALRCNSNVAAGSTDGISCDDLEAIEINIVPVFSRLSLLCLLANKPIPHIHARSAEEGSLQEDLADSRRQLFEVSDSCIRFIRKAYHKAAMFRIDVEDLVEQVKLQTRLDAWYKHLEACLEQMQAAGNPAKRTAVNLLLVQYKVIYIWIRVCTTIEENATDSYRTSFEELVDYAEQIVRPGLELTPPQPLSFELQLVGPLFYAALKCRYPVIRRRALELLQLAPRREGLWNAHHAYVTAKRVIELEERNNNGGELPDETSRIHGLPLPDDESRIYNPDEMPFDYRELDHSIVLSPAYRGTLEALFLTKPLGLLGEWQTITEYIKL